MGLANVLVAEILMTIKINIHWYKNSKLWSNGF